MQRYFVPQEGWHHGRIQLIGNDARHIRVVMRNKIGEKVICIRTDGMVALCTITEITKESVTLQFVRWIDSNKELPIYVTIAQALPKGNKIDFILQKGTEFGAGQFTFFESDRSIVKWDQQKSKQKLARFHKIVKEASEQCHRNVIPKINEPTSLVKLLEQKHEYDIMLFAYEAESQTKDYNSFAVQLKKITNNSKVMIFIGPEGGFSEKEVQLLQDYNISPIRLGPRILRTESASLYALACISYHFEELEV